MNLFHSPWLQTPTGDRHSFNRSIDRRRSSYRRARAVAGAVRASHALSERAVRSHTESATGEGGEG